MRRHFEKFSTFLLEKVLEQLTILPMMLHKVICKHAVF